MPDQIHDCTPRRKVMTADGRLWWLESFSYTETVPTIVTMHLATASHLPVAPGSERTVERIGYAAFVLLYQTLPEEALSPTPTPPIYNINQKHRNKSSNGSQWTIAPLEEEQCFSAAKQHGWLLGTVGWGLHFANAAPDYLGVAVDRERRLFIAKFVAGTIPVVWHGYPADPEKHMHDIPPEAIAVMWLNANVLSAPKIRKILRGQPCRL